MSTPIKVTGLKTRSGSNRSYAERAAKGRPNVTVSMPVETLDALRELAAYLKLSKSAVVDLAVRELKKRY